MNRIATATYTVNLALPGRPQCSEGLGPVTGLPSLTWLDASGNAVGDTAAIRREGLEIVNRETTPDGTDRHGMDRIDSR